MEQSGQLARPITSRSHGSNPALAIKLLNFNMKSQIDTSKLGVVIVDMQYDFLTPFKLKQQKELLKNHQSLIKLCNQKDIPIVIIEYEGRGPIHQRLLSSLSPLQRYKFLEKNTNSGFRKFNGKASQLNSILREWNLDHICITGIEAGCCVLATAKDAKEDYKVISVGDLLGDSSENQEKSFTEWFKTHSQYFPTYEEFSNSIN